MKNVNPRFPIGSTVMVMNHGATVKEIGKHKQGSEDEEFEYLCEPLIAGVKLCGCDPGNDCSGAHWFLESELIGFRF